jgi:hypothetical protein
VSSAAEADLDHLSRRDETILRSALPRFLSQDPAVPSNARKALDPNPLGVAWELRVGPMRAFYDVDVAAQTVRIERVGIKRGNELYVRGRRVDLRSEGQ